MNKKGSVIFISFMIGIVSFVLGTQLVPVLNEVIKSDEIMGVNGLDCSNASISNQDKAVCTSIDMFIPLLGGLIFGIAGMLITRIAIR